MVSLRAYQARCIEQAREQYQQGSRAICIVAPCGAGKTIIGSTIATNAAKKSRALWLAHRHELVDQARAKLPPDVEVATIQGLVASGRRPDVGCVVLDECHHFAADEWRTVADHYSGALRIGLTATPERADGRPLGDLFSSMVVAASYSELLAGGWLVPCDVYAPPNRGKKLAMSAADAVRRFSVHGPSIVFTASVGEAETVASEIPGAIALHEKTHADVRRRAVDAFRGGEVPALTSVYVLAEGFDATNAAVCVLARGCGHESTYLQMAGRVLRSAPGKTRAILVDLCGVVHDHGLPTEDREYSLDGEAIRRGKKTSSLWQCKGCGWVAEQPPAYRLCPNCGKPLPLPKALQIAERKLALQAARARHSDTTREQVFAQLRATAAARGYKPGWAAVQFKARYGYWPRG